MSKVFVYTSGNGYAYVDNDDPADSQIFTLYCVPDPPRDYLVDIVATDSQGYSIALDPTLEEQQIQFQASWVYINIYVTFSDVPFIEWLIPILKKKINKRIHKRL